ncbi:MAG TPA: hypothetical protein VHC90_26250 [Bryobacteraceae bacterium]|nr:hypothetical protein [Bryobacteraceae bacterium]
MRVRVFGITKPGIATLAGCVAILWSCFGLEIAMRHQASQDAADALRTIAELRHRTQDPAGATPVRTPLPAVPARTFAS